VKLTKGLVLEAIALSVGLAGILAGRYFAPEDFEIVIGVVGLFEAFAQAAVVYFVQRGEIEDVKAEQANIRMLMGR
jgi:hypothetical protein